MNRAREVVRFGSAGLCGLGVYYIAFFVLVEAMQVWYVYASVGASVAAHVCTYVLHVRWTFGSTNVVRSQTAVAYSVLMVGIFFLNLLLVWVLTEYVHLWYGVSQLCSTIVCSCVSYVVTRRILMSM